MSSLDQLLEKIRGSTHLTHETKRSTLVKFLLVLLIISAYFLWMSMEYGLKGGFMITLVTWTFFVFCTPVADAGFLIAFPLRLVTKIKMIHSQVAVYAVAAAITIYSLSLAPEVYDANLLLHLFRQILLNPIPYWAIMVISAVGTFISVYFGDELMDVVTHDERKGYLAHKGKHMALMVLFVIISMVLYAVLLQDLGVSF